MSKTKLAAVIVGIGLILIGFELGRYVAASKGKRVQYITASSGPPTSKPRPPTPAYPGPRPRAEFQKPQPAAPAASTPAAEIRAALLDVLREPNAFARASRLSQLLPTLGPEAAPEVRALFETRTLDLDGVDVELLVRFWATHDPSGAASWATVESPPAFRPGAIAAAYELWSKVDPQAAAKRVATMSILPGAAVDMAETALVEGWFDSGLPGLEDYIRDLGPGISQQRAVRVFARRAIQRNGPEAIARWAESIPDEDADFKLTAFRQLGAELALVDPAAARAWCDAHCDGPFGSNVRKLIAQRWAENDGRAAMEWLSTAPPGYERDAAVNAAFQGWFQRDREGFASWLAEMGPDGVGPWFQPALPKSASWIGAKDPAEGMKWAAAIEDDAARQRVFIRIARLWRAKDPSAADAWIDQSPLSEEAREKARTQPQPSTAPRAGRRRSPEPPSPAQ
jgi:hypothetical protein